MEDITMTDPAASEGAASNGTAAASDQPAPVQLSADAAAQRLQQLTVGLSAAQTQALLQAAERELARQALEDERAALMAQYNTLRDQTRALEERLGIEPVGKPNNSNDALLHALLQKYLRQDSRQDVEEGPGDRSKASLAKSMNRPKVWDGSNGGERRAAIFLREVKAWAELHGWRGEDILQNYLGDKVKSLFIQQLDAWEAEGIAVNWQKMCQAFCTIVGETEEEEKAKALDDLAGLRVRQKRSQSLGEYKVYFQHELLRAGGGVPDALAVRWFINGLGCKDLRSACQPDLTAGKLKSVDDAFLCAKGQEAKLAAVGTRPFCSTQHHGASTSSGTVAPLQAKPRAGGTHHQGQGHSGNKRSHGQAFGQGQAKPNKKQLPPGFRMVNNYPVNREGVHVCSNCFGTKDSPAPDCTKRFHTANRSLPPPPRN
jgi:hypothetical protein